MYFPQFLQWVFYDLNSQLIFQSPLKNESTPQFLSRKHKRVVPHYIKKRKEQEPKQPHKHHTHALTPQQLKEYILTRDKIPHNTITSELNTLTRGGGAVKNDSPRAPAIDHKRRSLLAMIRSPARFGAAPSKTHSLWWFDIAQAPNIMSELIPCLINPSTVLLLAFSHQAWKDNSVGW